MRKEVYWNLHKGIWSVRGSGGGKVCMHVRHVVIEDAQFIVQPAGRAKVLREKRKNVHAFVRGDYSHSSLAENPSGYKTGAYLRYAMGEEGRSCVRVRYNPYTGPTFVETHTGLPVEKAIWALLTMNVTNTSPEVWAKVNTEARKQALIQHMDLLSVYYSTSSDSAYWRQIVACTKALDCLE